MVSPKECDKSDDPGSCKLDAVEYEVNLNLQHQLNVFIDELIIFIIKKHNEGTKFDRIKKVIIQQISQRIDEFITLLSKDQRKSQHVWFLGLFYHYGISMDKDGNKAFELFQKASEENYSMAQVYLTKHYDDEPRTIIIWYSSIINNQ